MSVTFFNLRRRQAAVQVEKAENVVKTEAVETEAANASGKTKKSKVKTDDV